ncbi:MAG: hypothetical protein ACU0BF_05535 [Paracoccaceae bacterium]
MRLPLALALLPLPALAQPYGTPAGCERVAGAQPSSDMVMIYDPTAATLEGWESLCDVANVTQIGAGAMVLEASCMGEGDIYSLYYVLSTTMDPDLLVLTPEDSPMAAMELRRCD